MAKLFLVVTKFKSSNKFLSTY